MRALVITALMVPLLAACAARPQTHTFEVTAYCPCGECNGYERGTWWLLRLDFWNRRLTYGGGGEYTGATASGGRLRTPRAALWEWETLSQPWVIPFRVLLPWRALPRDGTIAADTDHYPFGTRMHIPGWGWGVVADRGGAIQGPDRLDILMRTHGQTNRWGRQHVEVQIEWPE